MPDVYDICLKCLLEWINNTLINNCIYILIMRKYFGGSIAKNEYCLECLICCTFQKYLAYWNDSRVHLCSLALLTIEAQQRKTKYRLECKFDVLRK